MVTRLFTLEMRRLRGKKVKVYKIFKAVSQVDAKIVCTTLYKY